MGERRGAIGHTGDGEAGLEATRRLRTDERKEILEWMSREGGEWGTESEDLGQRQVENLMELLPDALRWSREKQIGGWGL